MLDTDYVDGGAIMLRRLVVEEIGLFRTDFFMYFDETEYCLRAKLHGWKSVIVGRSCVHTRPIREERHQRTFYMVRNSVLLARIQRRYVVTTILRHAFMGALHLLRLRRQSVHDFPVVAWRAVVAGLRKPLEQIPTMQSDEGPSGELKESI